MLTTNLALTGKYDYLNEKFDRLYKWLKETDLHALPAGKYELDGKDLFVNVQVYETTPTGKYEAHKNYFDLQMVVEGEERLDYIPTDRLTPNTEYNAVKDVTNYVWTDEGSRLILRAGDFALVGPEDAHAPHIMSGDKPMTVKKVIGKIHL